MFLFHSLRIKRLDLADQQQVSSPAADFSRVAYYDAKDKTIKNSGNPFVADTVCARPFEKSLVLDKGTHLHFILPQTLTRFAENPEDVATAPNRWLVKKIRDGKLVSATIIESDYLSLEPQFANRPQSTTPVPIEKNRQGYEVYKNTSQPFRYVGRTQDLNDYSSPAKYAAENYWTAYLGTPFTAFAHGDPHFSSFYPNCMSVFGYYDPDGTSEDEYQVLGWYFQEENGGDFLSDYLNQIKDTLKKETLKKSSADSLKKELNERFGITTDGAPGIQSPDNLQKILFMGHTRQQDADILSEWQNANMALGNDIAESFSCFLSQTTETDPVKQLGWERNLEALQFNYLKQQSLDLAQAFEAGRHRKTFSKQKGISLFNSDLVSTKKQAKANALTSPNADLLSSELQKVKSLLMQDDAYVELKKTIEKLNKQLIQYEKKTAEIEDHQALLFSHWQKYLQAAHPPIGMGESLPDASRVLQLIADKAVPELRDKMQKTGQLSITTVPVKGVPPDTPFTVSVLFYDNQLTPTDNQLPELQVYQAANYEGIPDSNPAEAPNLATQIVGLIQDVKRISQRLNSDDKTLIQYQTKIILKHLKGQSFYSPAQPTLLLAVDKLKVDGKLLGEVTFSLPVWETNFDLKAHLALCENHLNKPADGALLPTYLAITEFTQPIFIDWELYFMPMQSIDYTQENYTPGFISRCFEIEPENPEFSISQQGFSPDFENISRYAGRTVSALYPSENIKGKLEKLSDENYKLFENTVNQYDFLVQPLDGFNAALVQSKSSMQLPIADPIALAEYKTIYHDLNLETLIGDIKYHTPISDFDFSPIRTGGFRLNHIALISTFGQQELISADKKDVHVPETMRFPAEKSLKKPAYLPDSHAFFYPRFMQSTCLQTYWMKADKDEPIYSDATPDNPICGWLVPNFLNEVISFYNAQGEHLGYARQENNSVVFEPGPHQQHFTPADIENKYLRNFAAYIQNLNDINKILELIHECLLFIDPETSALHNDFNYLFGRPLALTRMQVNLIPKGTQIARKDLYAFEEMLKKMDATPLTAQYAEVQIPIRIGDYTKLNEGVVMYWEDSDLNAFTSGSLTPAKNQVVYSSGFIPSNTQTINIKPHLTHSLAEGARLLTLLIDPRANTHLCSGVVPIKEMSIPERFWKSTLQQLSIDFEMGPVLFPRNEVRLNLPHIQGEGWTWLQKRQHSENKEILLKETPERPCIWKEVFEKNKAKVPLLKDITWEQLVQQGILVPGIHKDENYAAVQFKKLTLKTCNNSNKVLNALQVFFDTYSTAISPGEVHAFFTGNEIHEGWIELKKPDK